MFSSKACLGIFILQIFLFGFSHVVHAQKNLVFCAEGSPSNFNPQLVADGPSFNASSRTIFSRLVEFKHGSTELEPGLAVSWQISKDGLSYTFQLRKGVKFHSNEFFKPTRDFNADDVIYSFDVQKNPNHPYRQKTGNYEYFTGMELDKLIKEIKRVNDYEVVIVLTKTEAPFLANLAMDFASILSQEYAESLLKQGKDINTINTQPIGTGPFVFKSYQKDTIIRYTANPSFYKGKSKIDNLIFSITPDANVRFQNSRRTSVRLSQILRLQI